MGKKLLLKAKKLHAVPYSDNPSSRIIYTLTHEEYNQKFDSQYSESLYVKEEIKLEHLITEEKHSETREASQLKAEIEEKITCRLENPLSCLFVGRLPEEVGGYGLFTSEAIEENTLLFLYAGEIKNFSLDDDYCLNTGVDSSGKPWFPPGILAA